MLEARPLTARAPPTVGHANQKHTLLDACGARQRCRGARHSSALAVREAQRSPADSLRRANTAVMGSSSPWFSPSKTIHLRMPKQLTLIATHGAVLHADPYPERTARAELYKRMRELCLKGEAYGSLPGSCPLLTCPGIHISSALQLASQSDAALPWIYRDARRYMC